MAVDEKAVKQIKKILSDVMSEIGSEEPYNESSVQSLLTDYGTRFSSYLQGVTSENEAKTENTFMQAYRLTGESKVAGVTDFMETLIDNNCKFIVFAHHISVIDQLEAYV